MTYQRFIDREDKVSILKSCPDFHFRKHGMPPSWVLYSFVIAMLVVVIMVNYMCIRLIMLPENEPTPINEVLGFLFTISTLVLGIAFSAYIIVRRISSIVLHTEFQNLLFSSGMAMYSAFGLITHPQHGVVYFDYNFDQFFSSSADNPDPLDRLLSSGHLKDEDKTKIINAIANSQAIEIPFAAKGSGRKDALVLKLDPLPRPKGFSVLRAYTK